ncbi:hypothetical protein BRDID11004_12340 [Bradyrhizobium diazoefficiens]
MTKPPNNQASQFWRLPTDALCTRLGCSLQGLTATEAAERLGRFGPNSDAPPRIEGAARAVLRRLLEPLSLILLVAGIVSMLTGDDVGGLIIVLILAGSIGLDTIQEGHAVRAAEILRRSVALKAEVRRDGAFCEIDVDHVVPGDLLRVRAGDIIPADGLILESTAFTAGEAALTGEPYPVQKRAGAATDPDDTSNALFRGAVAQTGEAIALVVRTGRDTVFGAAASALAETQAPSPFERDLREFGLVIARATLALVLVVLTVRVVFGRPVLDSLLFAVALAVGLTPELLPMITTVTLSRGALRMAGRKVIVKRLAAIHDLGAMTVLCTDKTGTLTSAEITLARSLDAEGKDNARAAQLGAIAASLGGDRGSLDAALVAGRPDAAQGWPWPDGRPSTSRAGWDRCSRPAPKARCSSSRARRKPCSHCARWTSARARLRWRACVSSRARACAPWRSPRGRGAACCARSRRRTRPISPSRAFAPSPIRRSRRPRPQSRSSRRAAWA